MVVSSALSFAAFGYFWYVFTQCAAFMINLGHFSFVTDYVPIVQTIFPYSLDHQSMESAIGGDPLIAAFVANVLLLGFFAIPHSLFARPAMKKILGEPEANSGQRSLYRTVYVLQSSLALHLLMRYWQPVLPDAAPVWDLLSPGHAAGIVLVVLYLVAAVWTITSLFALDHFELLGVKQGSGIDIMAKLGFQPLQGLVVRAHYSLCRHPIMVGFFGLFFLVPVMTWNHVFFSVSCTTYILLAVTFLEEPDLYRAFPDEYSKYAQTVPAYCPFRCFRGSSVVLKDENKNNVRYDSL